MSKAGGVSRVGVGVGGLCDACAAKASEFWGDSGAGLDRLISASVGEVVWGKLSPRLGDACNASALLRTLVTPPSSVSLRLTCDGTELQGVEHRLREHVLHSTAGGGCDFDMKALPDLPPPICWLNCPEARVVVASASSAARRCGCTAANDFGPLMAAPPVDVLIDAACAMAVLRGADVFCMGAMASSATFSSGQLLRLWVVPEGATVPSRGSFLPASTPWSSIPAVPVAAGVAAQGRPAIFAEGARGVAVRVTHRRDATAPLAPLNAALSPACVGDGPDDELGVAGAVNIQRHALLQQLPSCLVARLLGVRPGDRVLDMCAAPGGKTTHLAQLLGGKGHGLVAVDRSLAKARRVEALCRRHGFSEVRCVAADSRHLCAEGAAGLEAGGQDDAEGDGDACDVAAVGGSFAWSEKAEHAFQQALGLHGADRFRSSKRIYKAVIASVGRGQVSRMDVNARLRQAAGEQHAMGGAEMREGAKRMCFPPGSFDRILLDPPCSAMGQRPLLKWGKTYEDVVDHASYQRHFLRTAARLLRDGGELVYSTCTITAEENEDNVRWALDELPLELLDARESAIVSGAHSDAAASGVLAGLPGCGLSEVERHRVLRFDPRVWEVGFFAARFRRGAGDA